MTQFFAFFNETLENPNEFQRLLQSAEVPVCRLGTIKEDHELVVTRNGDTMLQVDLAEAKAAWKKPLDWS